MLAMGKPEEALQKINEAQLSPLCHEDSRITVLTDLSYKCKAALILRSGVRGSKDPDAIATSIISSGASITAKAAKVLARLNLRRIRESEDCAHPWRDWQPPAEDSEPEVLGSQSMTERAGLSLTCERPVESESGSSMMCTVDGELHQARNNTKSKASGVKLKTEKNKSAADDEKAISKSKKDQFMRMMKSL